MKPPLKDTLLIGIALVAILGCGFGLGKRFAPKGKLIDPTPAQVELGDFEEETHATLLEELNLTDDQVEAIRADIESAGEDIAESRKRAYLEYHLRILKLHDEISPKLTPEQQKILQKGRDSLQEVIEKRFPKLLDSVDDSAGGGSKTRP